MSNESLGMFPQKSAKHRGTHNLIRTPNGRGVGASWNSIFHVDVPDSILSPEQVQGIKIEGLGSGVDAHFSVRD